MKILVLKTWLTNIGNGFIDKGAVALTKEAFPNADIVEVSGFANFVSDQMARQRSVFDTLRGTWGIGETPKRLNHHVRENVVDISRFVDADIVVFPGCVLYEWAIRKYKGTLERLRDENVPVIFLGAGGGDYTRETRKYMMEFLEDFEPDGLITRDSKAYDHYSEYFDVAHNGIDCAFFIDSWHVPSPADRRFVVKTFDKSEEPALHVDVDIVRPNHGNPLQGWRGIERMIPFCESGVTEGTFYSDSLEDYLFLYANAEQVHSDRIHAVVPSLVYDTPAKFHYDTPRAGLFENIELFNDDDGFLYLDRDVLTAKKNEQIEALCNIVEHCI